MATITQPCRSSTQDALEPLERVGLVPAAGTSDVPRLAPDVSLLGTMQGSGFADSMWLIQIEGRFIQVTELLYKVAEQCDGARTYEDIASAVSASTEWQMNADDARYLVEEKLVPVGVVQVGQDEDADGPAHTYQRAPSLLMLGLRRGVLSAQAIERLASRLQYLYLPILLLPLVALGAVSHGWLYFDRGIDGILSNVLYTPGLLLIAFLMNVLPGFWHEFGHASALRYSGGRARSIGVGIYIMDPAFYTDVTDSYRLSRWERIRTGLGGIYFDFILSTALIGAYLATGHEVLLLLVVLNNINTIYQFFPLVRLDGYWILADLTGVPDFYSMMGAFIRSIVPIPAWKGAKLPPLRPWVKVVFALYTLIGFPMMIGFLVILLRRVPGIYDMTWEALRITLEAMPGAWRSADMLQLAAQVSQVLMLLLTMVGLAWFLVIMARTILRLVLALGRHAIRRHQPAGQPA